MVELFSSVQLLCRVLSGGEHELLLNITLYIVTDPFSLRIRQEMFLHKPQQLLGSLGGMYIWFWRTHNTLKRYFVFGLCVYMCLLNTHRLAACSTVSASGSEEIETCGRVQCVCALCGVTHTLITVLDQCLPGPHHSPFTIHTHFLSHYKHTHTEMYKYKYK